MVWKAFLLFYLGNPELDKDMNEDKDENGVKDENIDG